MFVFLILIGGKNMGLDISVLAERQLKDKECWGINLRTSSLCKSLRNRHQINIDNSLKSLSVALRATQVPDDIPSNAAALLAYNIYKINDEIIAHNLSIHNNCLKSFFDLILRIITRGKLTLKIERINLTEITAGIIDKTKANFLEINKTATSSQRQNDNRLQIQRMLAFLAEIEDEAFLHTIFYENPGVALALLKIQIEKVRQNHDKKDLELAQNLFKISLQGINTSNIDTVFEHLDDVVNRLQQIKGSLFVERQASVDCADAILHHSSIEWEDSLRDVLIQKAKALRIFQGTPMWNFLKQIPNLTGPEKADLDALRIKGAARRKAVDDLNAWREAEKLRIASQPQTPLTFWKDGFTSLLASSKEIHELNKEHAKKLRVIYATKYDDD